MTARRLAAAAAVLTLAGSGAYVFIYLYRWEWNRALVSGVIFLAAEVGLVAGLLSERIRVVERSVKSLADDRRSRPLAHLRASAPPPKAGFAWLSRPGEMNVFVPVLMGAGVLLSALAWVVERFARATARPLAERHLAGQLGALGLPAHGFLDHRHDELALLRGPVRGADR